MKTRKLTVGIWSLLVAMATSITNYAQPPYGGTPHPIPGVIQAEDFDNGGEGVGYHATSPGNAGGYYRQTDIDIYPTTDTSGGYDVSLFSNEWLRYTVDVAQSGAYRVDLRMFPANGQITGNVQLLVDGAWICGPIPAPSYDGDPRAATWQNVTAEPVVLSAGQHVLHISMGDLFSPYGFPYTSGIRFNSLNVSPAAMRPSVLVAGSGVPGFADGPANQAQFSANITGVDVDQAGNIYVADAGNLRVRKVSPNGDVTTVAGNGMVGYQNGSGSQAQFLTLDALTVDGAGNCYVADQDVTNNVNRIRLISNEGVVSTFYEESTLQQPFPTLSQKITGLALDSTGRLIFSTYSIYQELRRWEYSSLVAIKNGSRSVLDSDARSSLVGSLVTGAMTTGHSTNISYIKRNFPYNPVLDNLITLMPDGTRTSLNLASDYNSIVGVTESPAGWLYVEINGQLMEILPDASTRLINGGPGFSGSLASDYSGNLYGFQNNRLYKVLVNYTPVALSLFTQGGGTITANPPGAYLSNTVVQVTATPSAGLQFIRWQGDVTGTNAQISLTMNASKTLQAVFGAQVSATPTTGGTVTRNPDLDIYPYNTQVTLTAQPNIGFEFFKWSDDNTNKVRTFPVTTAVNVQAVFAALPQFTLNAQVLAGTGGTLAAVPSQTNYYRDTQVTLYARPAAGYVFQTWLDGNLDDPRVITMSSNTTLFAVFAPGQGTVPTFTTLPKNMDAVIGDTVTFSVIASGSVPLEYQWSHDGTPISGQTGSTLTLHSVQAQDAGGYSVTVRNSVDSVSASASLNIITGERPFITSAKILTGQIQFTINGTIGQQYRIESSSDLATWTAVTTLANTLGTVDYSVAVGTGNLFYRVSIVQTP